MHATRPTLYGTRHAVSAGHYLAAAAGFSVLEAGGNAVDAGCAAGIALGVLLPDLVNVAGVAPILIRMADGTVETIAGLGPWPASIPADLFMREHGGKIPNGVLRTVVPAAPDAWITALERHGTMGFDDVAQHAIRYAGDGFAVYPLLAENIRAHEADYARWPGNAAIFLPGGRRPEVGEKFVQSDLARTLQYMADEEKKAAGKGRLAGLAAAHAAFYKGDIAREIAAFMAREGGYLTMADLAGYRSRIEPAVRRAWRGHEVLTCGPWCQGPALLEALLLFEKGGFAGMAHNSPEYLHLMAECMKAAMADREYHFGDPAFVDVPLDRLLADGHLAARLAEIDPDRALAGMPGAAARPQRPARSTTPPRAPCRWSRPIPPTARWSTAGAMPSAPRPRTGPGTRRWCRASASSPATAAASPARTRTTPAAWRPGKRPRLTPNPAMVVTEKGGVMPFGTPGGDVQIQAMLQVMVNILHFGMEVQEAIEAPRVASYSFPSSFAPFDYFPGRLAVEDGISQATRDALAAKGHEVKDWPHRTWLAGTVEVVLSNPETGLLAAGADPRRPAYAIAS